MRGGVLADIRVGVGGQDVEGVGGGVGVLGGVAAEGGAFGGCEFVENGGRGGRVAGGEAPGVLAEGDEGFEVCRGERARQRRAGAGEVGRRAGAVQQVEGVGGGVGVACGGAADVEVGVGQQVGEPGGGRLRVGGALEAEGGIHRLRSSSKVSSTASSWTSSLAAFMVC